MQIKNQVVPFVLRKLPSILIAIGTLVMLGALSIFLFKFYAPKLNQETFNFNLASPGPTVSPLPTATTATTSAAAQVQKAAPVLPKSQLNKKTPAQILATPMVLAATAHATTTANQNNNQAALAPSATLAPTIAPTSAPSLQPTPSPSPVANPQASSYQVTVDINGSSFSMTVSSGSNHCDVLQEALHEGKISSLNMSFNSSMNSNAVYQINGLGQTNQVWWVYKVNGQSPAVGCSQVPVHNNDQASWTYIGPK